MRILSMKEKPAGNPISFLPSSAFSPNLTRSIKRLRVNADIAGLLLLRLLLPFTAACPDWLQWIFSIYNIMALVTVLTAAPARLPEAGTTRTRQRQAWLFTTRWLPLLAALFGGIAWWSHPLPGRLAMPSFGLLMTCYIDELLFRNIVQPKLRTLGFSAAAAVFTQSGLYALAYAAAGGSLSQVLAAFVLGLFNGWVVYRYRSLWPPFAVSLAVHLYMFA